MASQQDLLTIAIPVFNEVKLKKLIQVVHNLSLRKEIIIVNDGSSLKKTLQDIQFIKKKYPHISIVNHTHNKGKSAAIQSALKKARGSTFVILDADMELDPTDIKKMYTIFLKESADFVFGVRQFPRVINQGLTTFIVTHVARLTTSVATFIKFRRFVKDPLVGLKMFKTSLLKGHSFSSSRFGIETEIISKAIQSKSTIIQVPISYNPRSYSEGKKIKIRDGIEILKRLR